MKKNATRLFTSILLVLCLAIPYIATAADDEPPGTDDPVDVPLDGGVSILVAAGVAYGAKKWKDDNKNNK